MNVDYYDTNGKKYTVNDGRVYDSDGYIGQFDIYGNFNTSHNSYQIDQYGNITNKASDKAVGKLEGNKFIPANQTDDSSPNSSFISNEELKAMFGFSWIDLGAFCLLLGFMIMGTAFGRVPDLIPNNSDKGAFGLALLINLLLVYILIKTKKLVKAIITMKANNCFSFSQLISLFVKEIIVITIFNIYFIKRSIDIGVNLYALFPDIWLGTIKGVWEGFISSF